MPTRRQASCRRCVVRKRSEGQGQCLIVSTSRQLGRRRTTAAFASGGWRPAAVAGIWVDQRQRFRHRAAESGTEKTRAISWSANVNDRRARSGHGLPRQWYDEHHRCTGKQCHASAAESAQRGKGACPTSSMVAVVPARRLATQWVSARCRDVGDAGNVEDALPSAVSRHRCQPVFRASPAKASRQIVRLAPGRF